MKAQRKGTQFVEFIEKESIIHHLFPSLGFQGITRHGMRSFREQRWEFYWVETIGPTSNSK